MEQSDTEKLSHSLMKKMQALQRQAEEALASSEHFRRDYNIPSDFISQLLSARDMPDTVRDRAEETLWLWKREADEGLTELSAATPLKKKNKRPLMDTLRI